MSVVDSQVFDEAKAELDAFITDNFKHLKYIVKNSPTSYDMRCASENYSEAWRIGFGRCLAELKRIAEKAENHV